MWCVTAEMKFHCPSVWREDVFVCLREGRYQTSSGWILIPVQTKTFSEDGFLLPCTNKNIFWGWMMTSLAVSVQKKTSSANRKEKWKFSVLLELTLCQFILLWCVESCYIISQKGTCHKKYWGGWINIGGLH